MGRPRKSDRPRLVWSAIGRHGVQFPGGKKVVCPSRIVREGVEAVERWAAGVIAEPPPGAPEPLPDVCAPLWAALERHRPTLRTSTADNYRRMLTRFEHWCKAAAIRKLDYAAVVRYRDERVRSVRPQSVNDELRLLALLFDLHAETDPDAANPARRVKRLPKRPTDRHRLYTETQLGGLKKEIEKDTALFLFCATLLGTLVRPGELVRLKRSDFDLAAGTVTVTAEAAKSGRARTVAVPAALCGELCNAWKGLDPNGAAFPHRKAWYAIRFAAVRNRLGWPPCHTLYALKHTGAVRLLQLTGKVSDVKEQMGHASLAATEIYLRGKVPALCAATAALPVW